MSTVTKDVKKARRFIKSNKDSKSLKQAAHRKARRSNKILVHKNQDEKIQEKPELTGWDIA